MLAQFSPAAFLSLYAPIFDVDASRFGSKIVNLEGDSSYREIDAIDPRNFLLNLLEATYRNLLVVTPRLLGLQITKAFTTANGNARVTYTVAFTYKDTRANLLLDEPTLEALPIPQ